MTTEILTQNEIAVNILADDASKDPTSGRISPTGDGVHEYDDPTDKWVIIVDGDEAAWHTGTQEDAWAAYHDMLRVEAEHIERNLLNAYQVPASSGYHAPSVAAAPSFTLLEVSAADIQAVNDGNLPGAWKAVSREGLPSGWPMAQVKRW